MSGQPVFRKYMSTVRFIPEVLLLSGRIKSKYSSSWRKIATKMSFEASKQTFMIEITSMEFIFEEMCPTPCCCCWQVSSVKPIFLLPKSLTKTE